MSGLLNIARPVQPDQLAPVLSMIPSLPRPVLARLVASMIDRMDAIDGDPDLEDSEASESHVSPTGRQLRDMRWWPTDDDEEAGDREPIDEREPDNCTPTWPSRH